MSGGSLLRHPPLRRVVTVAFVLVGPAVMVKTLDTSWICTYAILAMLSAVSLVFVATPKPTDGATDDESARRPLWMLAGSRSASRGVSDRVPVPARSSPKSSCSRLGRASALTTPIPLSGQVIWWSLAATVIAWTLRQTSRTRGPVAALGENLWTGLLRAFAGVAILLSLGNQVASRSPPTRRLHSPHPSRGSRTANPLRPRGPRERLARLLILALAVQQCLLAYPVAGSQMYLRADPARALRRRLSSRRLDRTHSDGTARSRSTP